MSGVRSTSRPTSPRRALVAVLACLAITAAACGGSSAKAGNANDSGGVGNGKAANLPPCPLDALASATAPVEVTVWHAQTAVTKTTLESMIAAYNASQTKVHVKAEAQGSYEELAKKYQSGIASKQLPGIAVMEDINTTSMADSKTVLPAQSCIDADHYDMSDFLPTAKAAYSIGGALYPGALNLSSPIMYVNKNHFRRAGLDPANPPKTLAEVRQAAEKIKAAGIVDKPLVLSLQPWFIESWLTGDHQPVVDNDNGRGTGTTSAAAFDNDATRTLYTWLRDMVRDGLLEPIPDTSGNVNDYLAMAQQHASMIIESSTAATSIKAFLGGNLDPSILGGAAPADLNTLDIGAGPLPGISQPGKIAVGGGAWYIMSTTPPAVQAAAWDFLKWFNLAEQQVTWNLQGSYLPFRISAAKDPRIVDRWSNDLAGRWLAISYGQITDGIDPAFPGPQIGPFDKVRDATRSQVEAMLFKGTDPAAAVAAAAKDSTAAIEQYNRDNF